MIHDNDDDESEFLKKIDMLHNELVDKEALIEELEALNQILIERLYV